MILHGPPRLRMTPERYRQIRGLYEAARNRDPADRSAFLSEACRGDEELGREVKRLLIAQERAAEFIDGPLLGTMDLRAEGETIPRMEGRRLGAYLVLRQIGRGGMGTVYLASRVDEVFHKEVAIKVVRSAADSVTVLRRFLQEREILATLDHPNIARMFDGGTTDEGLPYFVMEYVDGQPIDTWCNQKKLNVTERLRLFRSVCAAVQYAHQHLVVHCDLKPTNILVTSDGVVKLLDFGIAKLLHPQSEGSAATGTVTMLQAMTPEYASPEQFKGAPVSTATDVYSLGVVLYELLTGHSPYRMISRILHEVARVICEEEPTQPSAIITQTEEVASAGQPSRRITPDMVSEEREGSPTRLKRRLEGDLDNILLMALRKEPARRYGSVEQFDVDLWKHLEGLPVSARKDTLSYRLEKFVLRHWAGLLAAFFIAATLFAGFMTMLWQARLALRGQRQNLLLPQFALYNYATLALLGAVVYFSRARLRRLVGALTGAAAFALMGLVLVRVAHSLGWWQYAFPDMPPFPALQLWASTLSYAAILGLISWRVTRRFGWRGQLAVIGIMSIWGPVRGSAGAALTGLVVVHPGITPFVGWAAFWAFDVALLQGVMRVVAGPAGADQLASFRALPSPVPSV